MIPLRDLLDDYYEFDERNYCLIGRRGHKRYCLGDKVRIRVERANLDRKQLDFALVEELESPAQTQRLPEKPAKKDKTEKKGKKNKVKKGKGAKRFSKK